MKAFAINIYNLWNDEFTKINDAYVAHIDGSCCKNESDFHNEFQSQLNFPEYYGKNLDSLFDCLTDLEWIKQKNIIINITNFDNLLEEDSSKDYYPEALLLLLYDLVLLYQDEENTPDKSRKLYFLIQNSPKIIDLLKKADIDYSVVE